MKQRPTEAPPRPICPECGSRKHVAHVLMWTYGCQRCQVTFDHSEGVLFKTEYPFMTVRETQGWRHIRRADDGAERKTEHEAERG
jgi:hypothetical protein